MGKALMDRPAIWENKSIYYKQKNWMLFKQKLPLLSMVIPGIVFVMIFCYYPILGLQIAFKDFDFSNTMWSSKFNNFANFDFLSSYDFWTSVRNTFTLTFGRLIISFPAPIILALLINEIGNKRYKRVVQTISYMPHFVSWIIIAGLLQAFMNTDSGVVNDILVFFGKDTVNFLGEAKYFKWIFWGSGLWKEVGWGTVIYLAAIAGVNADMYEAAKMDGAGRLAQIRYITIPSILPVITIVLILSMPGLLSAGYDQIYPLINQGNIGAAEVIDTYVVRMGLSLGNYATTAAIGLVMSVLSFTLVVVTNFVSGRLGGERLF